MRHVHIDCAREGCYAVITVHPQEERRLRQTHERFYCPAGHSNYFPGKTEEEKTIERLRDRVNELTTEVWQRVSPWRSAVMELREGVRVCPMGCGYVSRRRLTGWPPDEGDVGRYLDRVWFDLREHMQLEHGAQTSTIKQIPAVTGEAR